METGNKNKLKIIVPVLLSIGLLSILGIGVNGWLNNQLEVEDLQSPTYVTQEVTASTLEDNFSNDNLDKQSLSNDGNTKEAKFIQGVSEDGNEYGENWTQAPEQTAAVDPNEVLSNGLTMADAKDIINQLAEAWKKQGVSEKEIHARLELVAKDMGTTLETLENLKVPTPTPSNNGNKGNNNGSQSGNQSTNNGGNTGNNGGNTDNQNNNQQSGGSYDEMPDWMKDLSVDGSGGAPDTSGMENPFK